MQMTILHYVLEPRVKTEGGQFRRFKKAPKLILVTIATSLERSQNERQFNDSHPHINAESLVNSLYKVRLYQVLPKR